MARSRLILLTVALLTAFGSAALTFHAAREQHSPAAPPPPEGLIALENPLHLGDVPQDTLNGVFKLVNRAENPVKIVRIAMSCRCTEIDVPDKEIGPGETVSLSFKWDTTGVRGVKGSSFTVFYTEEDKEGVRVLPFNVMGNILPLFDVVPDSLEFTFGQQETKTVKIVPRKSGEAVLAERVTCSSAAFEAEKISDAEFAITFLPEKWIDVGLFPTLNIHTDYSGERALRIPVLVSFPNN